MRRSYLLYALSALLLSMTLFLSACGENAPSVSLKIFAASSLTDAFNEIKVKYQSDHPNVSITYDFEGSQALVQKLANGAPADIFASADTANMQKAITADVVSQNKVFAHNKLMVIVPMKNPAKVFTLKDLARSGIKLDIAAPEVPVGKYTLQVLDKMGQSAQYGPDYVKNVKANAVSQEDNVKAVVQKVQTGVVDAGIVYLTDITLDVAKQVIGIDIPDNLNVVADYPIAVTKNSKQATEAKNFVDYILSKEGQDILGRYHFIRVDGVKS